jgi:hypothetical protein
MEDAGRISRGLSSSKAWPGKSGLRTFFSLGEGDGYEKGDLTLFSELWNPTDFCGGCSGTLKASTETPKTSVHKAFIFMALIKRLIKIIYIFRKL